MTVVADLALKSTPGYQVRHLRLASFLTQRGLAELADVPLEHVDLYEKDYPVPLDSRRKILKTLWAIKAKK